MTDNRRMPATASSGWQCPRCTSINYSLQPRKCSICKYELSQRDLANFYSNRENIYANDNFNPPRPTANQSRQQQPQPFDAKVKSAFNSLGQDFVNFFSNLNSPPPNNNDKSNVPTSSSKSSRLANNSNTNQNNVSNYAYDDEVILIDPKTNKPIKPDKRSTAPTTEQQSNAKNIHGLWACEKCTYAANPDWVRACDMCGTERSSSRLPPINGIKKSAQQDVNNNKKKPSSTSHTNGDRDADLTIYDTSLNEDIYDYNRIWACKTCTYMNFDKDDKCELCLTPRNDSTTSNGSHTNGNDAAPSTSSQKRTRQERASKWVCKACTYINSKNDERCILCNNSSNETKSNGTKAKTTSRGGINDVEWACEVCSHRNAAATDTCVVCSFNKNSPNRDGNRNGNEEADVEEMDVDGGVNFRNGSKNAQIASRRQLAEKKAATTPSMTFRSQKAKSIIKTYNTATSQAERIWNNIVRYCKENGHKFVDDSFPPCDKSLFIDPNANNSNRTPNEVTSLSNLLNNRKIHWLSPEYIRTHHDEQHLTWSVYNEPKFSDIKQGLLGNCWLLSGLAVILEQPEILRKIIITKEFCPQGCYQVRLCHNGEWQTVIVDDLFPCDSNGCLVYSQASRKQLWVPLIEKAMAKLNGSYEALIAGQTVEGLSALTGYPCDSIRLEATNNSSTNNEDEIDLDMIWARLLSMKEAGYVMGASCGRTDIADDNVFTNCGLLPRHAYSVLNVKEINGHQLIQLRNPWGRYTWQGDWSENSSKWTPEMRKALGLKPRNGRDSSSSNNQAHHQHLNHMYNHSSKKNSDQGVFWISFNDFVQYFCSIDVCKTRLDWFESRMTGYLKSEGTRDMQVYHLIVFETSEIDIGLFHKTVKNRRENSDLDLSFVVLRATNTHERTGHRVVGKLIASSKRSVRKFIGYEHIFEPGEYTIVPLSFNFWYTSSSLSPSSATSKSSEQRKSSKNGATSNGTHHQSQVSYNNLYNLVIHSPKVFFLEQEMQSGFLLADSVIQLCLSKGVKTSSGLENACMYTLTKGWSGLIVIAENCNESHFLHIELDCERSNNVVSTRQALVTKDSVPPLHRQVLIVLTHLEGSSGFSIQYSIKYRLSSNPYMNTWPGIEGQYITNSPEINKQTLSLHAPRSLFNYE